MKNINGWAICLAIALLISLPSVAQTGNGAPSGSHYNLNIIGMADSCQKPSMTDSNRHTIFVDLNYHDATPTDPTALTSLDKKNKIFLQEGPFAVIDGNACDGAIFQLPAPGCDTVTTTTVSGCDYSVWIRGLGKPGGSADMTTCVISDNGTPGDTTDDYYQCSTETVHVERNKGKSTFTNVTKQLLTVCLDTDTTNDTTGKTCDTRVQLFDSEFYAYFWDYDNFGLRLAQLRFYPATQ